MPAVRCFLNPSAGRAREVMLAIEDDRRLDVRETSAKDIHEAVRREVDRGADRVVVAGGDGTVAAAASALVGTDVALGLIPAGTLNHFARHLSLPVEPGEAIEPALATRPRAEDVGFVNDHLILNTCSLGAYVRFVHDRERLEARFGYAAATVAAATRTLVQFGSGNVTVAAHDRSRRYRTPLVFVGIGERELSLPALGDRIDGGRRGLHLLVVSGPSAASILGVGLAAIMLGTGRAARGDGLDSVIADSCTVGLSLPTARVAVDGELFGLETPIQFRHLRDALLVAAP